MSTGANDVTGTFDRLQTQARAANALAAELRKHLRGNNQISKSIFVERVRAAVGRYQHAISARAVCDKIFGAEERSPEQQVIDASYREYKKVVENSYATWPTFSEWLRQQSLPSKTTGAFINDFLNLNAVGSRLFACHKQEQALEREK